MSQPARSEASPAIAVIGDGALAGRLARRFATGLRRRWPDQWDSAVTAAIGVCAAWRPGTLAKLTRRAHAEGVPLLLIHGDLGSVVVGPFLLPGQPGCHTCCEGRRHRALANRPLDQAIHEKARQGRPEPAPPPLPAPVRELVSALAEQDIARFLGGQPPLTRRAFYRVVPATGRLQRHCFLPDPSCSVCGDLPADSRAGAELRLRPRAKLNALTPRVRQLDGELAALMDHYVDRECGLIGEVTKNGSGVFTSVTAGLGLWDSVEYGVGRSADYASAAAGAIAEALERYGGLRPGGKRTVVRDSYQNLAAEPALDPRTLGLPPPEQISHPGSRYRPYHPGQVMNWVWGYSLRSQRPLLVPESCAYYYLPAHADPPFVYEISNGCALGGCLEEAILHGLLEVAERDAFLATWYARLPAPRLDISTAAGPAVRLMVERFEHVTGYRVHGYDITMPEGIPCVWVMAVDEAGRPEHPKALCAAGSSLSGEQAFTGALHELGALIHRAVGSYGSYRERALRMVSDPDLVAHMDDHWMLYAMPEAWPRLGFLSGSEASRAFPAPLHSPGGPGRAGTGDRAGLTGDLIEVTRRFLSAGLDVIVVDQTAPEHRVAQLSCVKVLVPGTLSMTFGHRQRRTGVPRLRTVGLQLGYHRAPLPDADINPHPHPFP